MKPCPDRELLAQFAVGAIDDRRLEQIALHVADCPDCDQRLAQLDGYQDQLLGQLQTISTSTQLDPADGLPPRDLGERILETIDRLDERQLTFDAGRRLSNQLQEGGCRIGRFELQEEIGVGAFGHVFRARDTQLDRVVAIKVQRAGEIAEDVDIERFLREARNASALTHPNIVTLHETGRTDDGVCYLVSEYVAGRTLAECLEECHYSAQEAARLAADLADAVHFAHEGGVVHRDIKPSNIIVDADGRPHITDFGLAKRDTNDESLTSDGRIMGTPAYMSPEQARGERHVTRSTDIYSLGVILYELSTGQRPFQGAKRLLLLQVLEDEPRPPRHLEPRLPRDLETICLKAMAKSPARRYRTAEELADDLRAFLSGDAIRARPVNATERLWKWCRRYPLAAAIFLGVTVGSALGFGYLRYLNTWFVREMALDTARQYSNALEEFNSTYSDVRGQFFGHGEDTGAVPPPLPATLQIEVAERISDREDGMQVRIFSPHSFRSELRPNDEFELQTVAEFRQAVAAGPPPSEKLERYEFVRIDGRDHLRFARGQLMKQSCIECHNTHKASPKQNWVKGDLAGVLTLTRPLDRDIDRTNAGFQGASALMFAVAALMTICGLVLARRKQSRRSAENSFP